MSPAKSGRRKFWRHVWALLFGFSYKGSDGHRYGRAPRREWTAHNPFGYFELGYYSREKAIAKVAKMGKVTFVDEPNGLIFYDTHLGRSESAN